MSRPSLGRTPVNTYIFDRYLKLLDAWAADEGCTRTDLINQAVRDYVSYRKRHERFVNASMPDVDASLPDTNK